MLTVRLNGSVSLDSSGSAWYTLVMKTSERHTQERVMKQAERYDHINNEGGEGYNPHRDSLVDIRAEIAEAKAEPRDEGDIIRDLERVSPYDQHPTSVAARAELKAELAAYRAR